MSKSTFSRTQIDNATAALRGKYATLSQVAAAHKLANKPRTWRQAATILLAIAADRAESPRPRILPEVVAAATAKLISATPLDKHGKVPRATSSTIGGVIGRYVELHAPHCLLDSEGHYPLEWSAPGVEWIRKARPQSPSAAIKSALSTTAKDLDNDREKWVRAFVPALLEWGVPAEVLAEALVSAATRARQDSEGQRLASRAGRAMAKRRKDIRQSLDRVEETATKHGKATCQAKDTGASSEAIAEAATRGTIRGQALAGHLKLRRKSGKAKSAREVAERAALRAAAANARAAYAADQVAAAVKAIKS